MPNDSTTILVALAIGALLLVGLFALVIPEPAERAVVATDRLDVAVLGFGNSSAWPSVGETVRARCETRLVNTPGINVFSRTRLDALLTEQRLGEAGLIDQATAARIGSLIGVNKLVTGSVYSVQTALEETTVCEEWSDGDCIASVPATLHSVRVLAQVEVLNAHTGQIERAVDAAGSDGLLVKQGTLFSGFDPLVAVAADQIADQVASLLTGAYTRELRYDLYHAVRPKRHGFVGSDASRRFSSTAGAAQLVVHFTRIDEHTAFSVRWLGPDGQILEQTEDIVSPGDWRNYTFDLSDRSPGRYEVTGTLAELAMFRAPFAVTP